MNKIFWIVLLAMAPGLAQSQAVRTERNITFNGAMELATTALEACRKQGFNVTITVLDKNGRTKVILSDDASNPHTVENSMRKAYTSVTFRVPSGDYGKRFISNPQGVGALHLDRITTLEGALPIRAGNDIVGAIGISGAPGGDKDAACAQVGLDRIAKGLTGG